MKIEGIETVLVHNWLLVRVVTDTGLTGVGESTYWAHPTASQEVVNSFKEYLLGQDPLRIEHHWHTLYRGSCFRGGALMGALSAIDVALWDIMGKHLEVPVYQLLGGKLRDRVRVILLIGGDTVDDLVAQATKAVRDGFTALKFTPMPRDFATLHQAQLRREIVTRVAAVREAVGPDIDLGIEIHRRLNVGESVAVARELEPFRVLFYEDPVPPESIEATNDVARKVSLPLATGERYCHLQEFRDLLAGGGAQLVKPDIGYAGGFTGCKKISALAEAYEAGFAFHHFLSPVTTAACVQLDACIPNFTVQEYAPDEARPPKSQVVKEPLKVQDGYLIVPDRPGIGVELNEDAVLAQYPFKPRQVWAPLREDRSPAHG